MKPEADVLFEVAFEVCNKVGGIYAVLKSKAARMTEHYKDNYFAVGPYFKERAVLETMKQKPPEFMKNVLSELGKEGIKCFYGKWLIPGKPNVILIDYFDVMKNAAKIKERLWEDYKIDSWDSSYDFDEPVVWSTAVGMLLEKIISKLKDKKVVCQFHEWMSGAGMLYLKDKVPTVFTTHATMLGRTIAGHGEDLYAEINSGIPIDPKRSYKYGIQAKHLTEKACVENCNIFTTVSEITGKEAEYIHGRKPDVILPNGLDSSKFPTMEELAINHRKYRQKIKDFLNAYFGPYYENDLWDCMLLFTSGRYEFRNKGYDVFIDALGLLNERMKKENVRKCVFAFFFVPSGNSGPNVELLESIRLYEDMQEGLQDEMPWIEEMIIASLVRGKMPKTGAVFRKEFIDELKRKILAFKKRGNPPLSAFNIEYEGDSIIEGFKKNNLLNKKVDKVKVIFYPSYLSTTDKLLGLSYEQAVQGTHLGVFPSYYEPWGYTPLDAAENGVLAITSDLAGFGIFIKPKLKKDSGIMVLERDGKSQDEIVKSLSDMLWNVVTMRRKERIPKKAEAKDLATLSDWKIIIKNYVEAHNLALERFSKKN
jgi:glycogen(starch) synthase